MTLAPILAHHNGYGSEPFRYCSGSDKFVSWFAMFVKVFLAALYSTPAS